MKLNEIFKGMFDAEPDKLIRELSKLFYKVWAPKMEPGETNTQYDQMMTKYKELSASHRKGLNVTDKLTRLRDVVKHAAKKPRQDVVLRTGRGFYESKN